MKKILIASIAFATCGISAFGQGQVLFGNESNSSSFVTLYSSSGPKTGSGLVVELLWYNGSSFVLEDTFTSTFTGIGGNGQSPGQFIAGYVTIPHTGMQTFEVEGFYTTSELAISGITAPFTATVDVLPTPPLAIDTGIPPTGWDGNLVLTPIPEPATIALGGLGATVLWLFRQRRPSLIDSCK